MKEMLEIIGKYNKHANKEMITLLEGLDEGIIYRDLGLYYKSIAGVIAHYTASDASFFKDYFSKFCNNPPKATKIEAMLEQPFCIKHQIIKDTSNLFAAREEIDNYIIGVINDMQDIKEVKTLDFPWASITKPLYTFVWAVLNHGTHHRGMIASALDSLKIENDFNGALRV